MSPTTRLLVLCAALMLGGHTYAQKIENLTATFNQGRVVLTYDLTGTPDQKFQLELFSSHDNFTTGLRRVTGDVGSGIKAGPVKRIEWDLPAEIGTFKGQISFKIRGSVIAPDLAITSPKGGKLTIGSTATIQWSGGTPGQQLNVSLLKEGAVVKSVGSVNNTGMYRWSIPSDIEKGEYQLQVSGGSQSATSEKFLIKSKLPLWVKLSPIAVGAVVAILLLGGDDPPPTGSSDDLPTAPGPK